MIFYDLLWSSMIHHHHQKEAQDTIEIPHVFSQHDGQYDGASAQLVQGRAFVVVVFIVFWGHCPPDVTCFSRFHGFHLTGKIWFFIVRVGIPDNALKSNGGFQHQFSLFLHSSVSLVRGSSLGSQRAWSSSSRCFTRKDR